MCSRLSKLALLGCAAIGFGAANVSGADVVITSQTPASQSLSSTFQLDAGLFVMGQTTKASLNGQGTTNPEIDFNRDFGTGYDTNRFRIDSLWRISARHHIEFMYFTNGVSRTRGIPPEDPIKWGDYAFSGSVTARSRLSVYELGYEYAFIKNPTLELAAGIGVHYTRFKLDLEGTATLTDSAGGTTTTVNGAAKEASVPAPLPVLSLRGGWAFADNWLLDGQVQLLGMSFDQFHGQWWDLKAGVTYLFNKNIGLGVAYDSFTTQIDIDQTRYNGRLHLGYGGGLIFIRAAL
jgi:hypothetical protein